jgi:hypothetical protein
MRFSRRTLASLARVISEYNTNSDLDALAYEFGKEDSAVGSSKIARCVSFVKAVEKECAETCEDRQIIDIIEKTLSLLNEWQFENSGLVSGLLASLQIDGFHFSNGVIMPTTPEPASLGPILSQLEQDLSSYELKVASRHYSQACENLADGNFEAANGQVRSFLENLFVTVCDKTSGKNFKDPGAALQHLKQIDKIDASEWNNFRGFWDSCQSNGPHHGLSTNEEAIYRLHMATAIARYLLYKFSQENI